METFYMKNAFQSAAGDINNNNEQTEITRIQLEMLGDDITF